VRGLFGERRGVIERPVIFIAADGCDGVEGCRERGIRISGQMAKHGFFRAAEIIPYQLKSEDRMSSPDFTRTARGLLMNARAA